MTIQNQAKVIKRMDDVITLINDEECDVIEDWKSLYVPDQATEEEIAEFLEDGIMDYEETCEFFARRISKLIVDGAWSENGHSVEFFKP